MPHRIFVLIIVGAALSADLAGRFTDLERATVQTAIALVLIPLFALAAWKQYQPPASEEPVETEPKPQPAGDSQKESA